MTFDTSGHLYFSIGDRGFADDAQDLTRPNGKIHRVHSDGRIPPDNPYELAPFPSIWTIGHRNPQGLTTNPWTGELWALEHGPRGGDELNVLTGGDNYGWPLLSSGLTYGGEPISSEVKAKKFTAPVHEWSPSITPSSMMFYDGERFRHWKGNLFVGSLNLQDLRRLEIRDRRVVREEVLFTGLGRVRDVTTGPDGNIYLVLNQPDRIARVTLVEEHGARQ
jgi:glucose/arabinose dehydrogenase